MVTASVAGICDRVKPGEKISLEGVALIQPFRRFELTLDLLTSVQTITSPEEAWTAFKASDTARLFVFNDLPSVDLDGHLPWSGNAANEQVQSVLSTRD